MGNQGSALISGTGSSCGFKTFRLRFLWSKGPPLHNTPKVAQRCQNHWTMTSEVASCSVLHTLVQVDGHLVEWNEPSNLWKLQGLFQVDGRRDRQQRLPVWLVPGLSSLCGCVEAFAMGTCNNEL